MVHNPVAGIHAPGKVEHLIRQKLDGLKWQYEFYQTTNQDSVVEVAIQAREFGCVAAQANLQGKPPDQPEVPFDLYVAAGGDGTVSAVASALAWSDIPLLIIPSGTGNGLARDLKLPLRLEKAVDLFDYHQVQRIDGMKISDRFYLLNVSAGLTPAALKLTDRKEKDRFGRMAYIFAGLRALLGIQPVNFLLTIDGERHAIQASEMILMNSISLGSTGRFLELGIENDDGVLDLFIIQSRTFMDYLRVFWNFLLRRPQADPDVKRFSVRHSLSLEAAQSLEVQADGDLIGYTPMHVEVCPKAFKMVVPNHKENPSRT